MHKTLHYTFHQNRWFWSRLCTMSFALYYYWNALCVFNNLRLLYVTSIPLYGISEFHRRCNISSISLSLNLKPAYLIVLYTITCTPIYAKTPFNEKWWKCTRVELVVYCTLPNIHSTPFGFFNSTRPTVPNKVNIVSKKVAKNAPDVKACTCKQLPSLHNRVEQLSWSS